MNFSGSKDKTSNVIEELILKIKDSKSILPLIPNLSSEERTDWSNIPTDPGIYAISRLPEYDSKLWFSSTKEASDAKKYNLEWINPLVIYIGQASNLRKRITSHFRLSKHEDLSNSIFQKSLIQIFGDWQLVKQQVLHNAQTGLCWVLMPENAFSKKEREDIEKLAILTLTPRINSIKLY